MTFCPSLKRKHVLELFLEDTVKRAGRSVKCSRKKARKNYPIFRVFRTRDSSGGRTSKICN